MKNKQETLWLEKKFDELYKTIDDPWGCNQNKYSFSNRLFTEMIFYFGGKPSRILDIGCGYGGLTEHIRSWSGGSDIVGVDISQEAVNKAKKNNPACEFVHWDILKHDCKILGSFNLIYMSEIFWYICHEFDMVMEKVNSMLIDGADQKSGKYQNGLFAIHQYFPVNQKYYKEYFDGMESFENKMKSLKWNTIAKIIINVNNRPVLLALYNRG